MIPQVQWRGSPNYNIGRFGYAIRAEVKHRIVGSLQSCINVFADPNRQASTHFGIGTISGVLTIAQFVDLSDMAWGNGDVREPTWTRIIPNVNPNFYTVSTEHEDGGSVNRGVISEPIWQASMELSALLRSGNAALIRAQGIRVKDNASVAQLAAMPIDAGSYIDHNQIAGPNKPYCLRRWLDDPGFVEGSPSRRDRLLAYLKAPEDDMAWMDRLKAVAPYSALVATGAAIRRDPDLQAASFNIAPAGFRPVFIGEVVGESADDEAPAGSGNRTFACYLLNAGGVALLHTSTLTQRMLVGGGYTQVQLDAAKAASFAAAKSKAKVAVEGIKP